MPGSTIPRRPVVIGAAVAAAAILAIGGWMLAAGGRPPALADDEAKAMAAAFLDLVRAGKSDDAWAATAADFKSFQGRDDFRKLVRSKPAFKAAMACQGCEVRRDKTPAVAECAFKPAAGGPGVKVILAPEGGQWKVGGVVAE